jgi:putative thiamine transport system ATP-binding protein
LGGIDLLALPAEARHAGLLFQDPLLFPHLSVRGNLLFGMPPGLPDRQAHADAKLAEAGLEGYGPRDPATLSGGQKARVALLRVLLSQPRAMLLDEPFSALDTALRQEMRQITFDAIRRAELPCILVTHDHADAEAAGGHVIALAG